MKQEPKMQEMSMEDKARKQALMDLKDLAMELINKKAHGEDEESEMMPEHMQKVMVAAKDKEGLMKGLDKAEDVLESMPESADMEDESEEEDMNEEMPSEDEEAMLMRKLEEIRRKKAQKA